MSAAIASTAFAVLASSRPSRQAICCIRNSGGIAVLSSARIGTPPSSHRQAARFNGSFRRSNPSLTRTAHCIAARCAAAPPAAKRSGWTSACNARRLAARSSASSANRRGRSKRAKSSRSKSIVKKEKGPRSGPADFSEASNARSVRLDPERLAAAAAILLARIAELEALVQALADEVEFRPVDIRQALGVDDDLDALVFEHLV